MTQILQVQSIVHKRGSRQVLTDVSFNVEEGQIVGLLGPNGSGKSTLLSLLCGNLCVQEGDIWIAGKPALSGGVVASFARAQMGVVAQDTSCDKKLSALANLQLGGQLYAVERSLLTQRIENGLRHMGLLDRAHDAVKTFSGGMRRRLELVRALLHEPRLLLMDEPSASLDQQGVQDIWARIISIVTTHRMGVLVATHRTEEAELCHRLIVLKDGRVVANDTPHALKSLVRGDHIDVTLNNQASAEEQERWRMLLKERLQQGGVEKGNMLSFVVQDGPSWVPRLVEVLPPLAVESVSVRKPSLADAYVMLTGNSL